MKRALGKLLIYWGQKLVSDTKGVSEHVDSLPVCNQAQGELPSDSPPEHWLDMVRKNAPSLLSENHQNTFDLESAFSEKIDSHDAYCNVSRVNKKNAESTGIQCQLGPLPEESIQKRDAQAEAFVEDEECILKKIDTVVNKKEMYRNIFKPRDRSHQDGVLQVGRNRCKKEPIQDGFIKKESGGSGSSVSIEKVTKMCRNFSVAGVAHLKYRFSKFKIFDDQNNFLKSVVPGFLNEQCHKKMNSIEVNKEQNIFTNKKIKTNHVKPILSSDKVHVFNASNDKKHEDSLMGKPYIYIKNDDADKFGKPKFISQENVVKKYRETRKVKKILKSYKKRIYQKINAWKKHTLSSEMHFHSKRLSNTAENLNSDRAALRSCSDQYETMAFENTDAASTVDLKANAFTDGLTVNERGHCSDSISKHDIRKRKPEFMQAEKIQWPGLQTEENVSDSSWPTLPSEGVSNTSGHTEEGNHAKHLLHPFKVAPRKLFRSRSGKERMGVLWNA